MTERYPRTTEVGAFAPNETEERSLRDQAVAPALGELSIQPRLALDLHVRSQYIRLGQKKMPFRLSNERIDYSEYRYRFLKALADSQSDVGTHPAKKPFEIWEAMGQEGKVNNDAMIGIKRWLPTLSYRKQPLIEGNGKRGRGATYTVNQRFLLNVIEKMPAQEVDAPQIPLPDAAEVYESVRHLAQFDFALREYGILELEPDLEMALQEHKPDYSELKKSGSIKDFRADALAKLDLLLRDKDYIARYKQALDKKSPEYGLLRYIYDLSPNERFFVGRLLRSTVEPHIINGELRLEAIDENGMLIAVISPKLEVAQPDASEKAIAPSNETPEAVIFDRKDEGAQKQGEITFKNELEEAMVNLIEDVAATTALAFLERFKADKIYTPNHLKAAFPKLRTELIVSARDNNVLPRNQHRTEKGVPGLSLRDTIKVMLYSDSYLQNMVTTRKYKKQIESIIDRVVDEQTEQIEKELSGETDEF